MHTRAVDASWDPEKAQANLAKHGVAFEDAEIALYDPAGLTREDPDARLERRFVTVVYTHRGPAVRLISARPATRKETDAYAKGI